MEQGGLTVFDWLVVAVVGISGLLALFRGFIREIMSLLTWLLAAFVTVNYHKPIQALLTSHIHSKTVLMALSTIGLFLSVLVVFAIINALIIRFLQAGGDISILDSVLGMCFGVARGLFILSLGFLMLSVVMTKDEYPDWLKHARTRPFVEFGANILAKVAPNYVNEVGALSKQAKEEGEKRAKQQMLDQMQKTTNGSDTSAIPAEKGYDSGERNDLDRVLKTLQREQPATGNVQP